MKRPEMHGMAVLVVSLVGSCATFTIQALGYLLFGVLVSVATCIVIAGILVVDCWRQGRYATYCQERGRREQQDAVRLAAGQSL